MKGQRILFNFWLPIEAIEAIVNDEMMWSNKKTLFFNSKGTCGRGCVFLAQTFRPNIIARKVNVLTKPLTAVDVRMTSQSFILAKLLPKLNQGLSFELSQKEVIIQETICQQLCIAFLKDEQTVELFFRQWNKNWTFLALSIFSNSKSWKRVALVNDATTTDDSPRHDEGLQLRFNLSPRFSSRVLLLKGELKIYASDALLHLPTIVSLPWNWNQR